MSDYQQYIDRKNDRKSVQIKAAQVLAEIYKDKGARVQVSDRNVYVYFDQFPLRRFKVQPISTVRESRLNSGDWIIVKKYNTTKLSKVVPGKTDSSEKKEETDGNLPDAV